MQKVFNKRPLYKLLLSTFFLFPSLLFSLQDLSTITIPMRDGVLLHTDLYFPHEKEMPAPCILLRTPYDRTKHSDKYRQMAKMGYVVAVQNLRSHTYAKDFPEPYLQDGWGELKDSYDTIEWLANSDHTNGHIGTFGPSACGIVQLLAAPTQPPHLKCQFIQVATPSLYHHAAYVGGKFCKHQMESWFAKAAPLAFKHVVEHKDYDSYWEQIDATKKIEKVNVPAVHYGGWYDIFSQGTLDAYASIQEKGAEGARGKQRLVMGPWTHWGMGPDQFGQFPYPEAIQTFSEAECMKSWFDYHLKNDQAALENKPPVLYYTMGPLDGSFSKGNRWKTADTWPPKAQETSLYLTRGNRLLPKQPLFSTKQYHYTYNPENPVPTHGGRNLYLEAGPYDQSSVEAREDVLSFTTDILEQDTEITGRIKAKIYISSNQPITDVALTLTDVYPNGASVLIAEGIREVHLENNKVTAVEVDLWSTSMVFAQGHRIRLNVAASNYPHFDKNEHSSDNFLHVGSKYPSQIILPKVLD